MRLSPVQHLGILIKSLLQPAAVSVASVWPLSSPSLGTLLCYCFKYCFIWGISWVHRYGHQTVKDRTGTRKRGPMTSVTSPSFTNSEFLWLDF